MSKPSEKFSLPTIFVIFGITGDLTKSKLLPALYNLHRKSLLPTKFEVIGFSRRSLTNDQLCSYIRDLMNAKHFPNKQWWPSFLERFTYIQGEFGAQAAYKKLALKLGHVDGDWHTCSNKLFYLAVPPEYYRTILNNLHDSGLTIPCSPEEGWTRVILEKPFGKDLKHAQELDELLGKLFKEEQIYRVDHFLGKETVRNILAFRFSNSFLAPSWNNKYIETIHIRLFESERVTSRGEFYDAVGTLRDVGQNHLLQLLALFTMGHPIEFNSRQIWRKRIEVLSALKVLSGEEVKTHTLRGQYKGYRQESGVSSTSTTETYFKIKTEIANSRWRGVDIYLEAGKAMLTTKLEAMVTFKHQNPCLCPPGKHYKNVLHYKIQPHEQITTQFLVKRPGYDNILQPQSFKFDYKEAYKKEEFIEAYEKLLVDMMKGDQTLFVTTEEILQEWHFVEPILDAWSSGEAKLFIYPPRKKIEEKLRSTSVKKMHKEFGIIGLGKMGGGLALAAVEKNWRVVGYNRSPEKSKQLEKQGINAVFSFADLVKKLKKPRVILLMVPAGKTVDTLLFGKKGLVSCLSPEDIIVDAGNSYYKDSLKRANKLKTRKIRFVDVGVSGGPIGARRGASFMVGGEKHLFEYLLPLFIDLSVTSGVQFFEGTGAGHFVKMVHNGIEYGMMQAIAEGFSILKKASYELDLKSVAQVYNNGSVVESRLIGWLKDAFSLYGNDLDAISSRVVHTGEGAWTVKTAKEMDIVAKVIEDSLQSRIDSAQTPNFSGKVVSALRGQFGGHEVVEKK